MQQGGYKHDPRFPGAYDLVEELDKKWDKWKESADCDKVLH